MDPTSILLFIFLFGLSAFFSGSEIAFMSIPGHTIDMLVKKRKFGARTLRYLKKNTERLLITILIGNNLVNVLTSAIATKLSIDFAEASGRGESTAIGIATGTITLMILLFGEIMPKTFATRYAVPISLYVSQVYYWLQIFLKPIVISIEWIMKLFQSGAKDHLTTVTPEEIESLVELGKKQGAFDEVNYRLIKNMLKFEEITAEEIMTPRVKIEALKSSLTIDEAVKKAMSFCHSRIPVYDTRIDDIDKVITLRELIELQRKGKGDQILKGLLLNDIQKIPLTQPVDIILGRFKTSRRHIAIAMDQYGGVAGLVTLEDVIEAVFGDFHDETDKEIKAVQKLKKGYLIQADITIDELLEVINVDYHDVGIDAKEFGGETIAYYITSHLERFPRKGEVITLKIKKEKKSKGHEEDAKPNSVMITVHQADHQKIESVIVHLKYT